MEQNMTIAQVEEMLKEHEVRPTANRIAIIRAMAVFNRPVSLSELEIQLETIDKSGIFRALNAFKEQHIVHVIEDGSDSVKYELCHSHDHLHDDDAHAHFYCEHCGRTYCLEDIHTPAVNLPDGYILHSTNYLIKGICPRCSTAAFMA